MPGFLIDANLPYRFAVWRGPGYQHVFDLGPALSDRQIWDHARRNDQIIVSKDADFSDWVLASDPPPRVVLLKLGNLRIRQLHVTIQRIWSQIVVLAPEHRLVIAHADKLDLVA